MGNTTPQEEIKPYQISVNVEELQKKKLFLATPMYGGMCHGSFSRSVADLSALCRHYQIPFMVHYMSNESLIQRARNYCCDVFLRSGCTHMMFIDADIGFKGNDVIGLLAMMDDDSEFDVLCAPYPKKCISWEKIKMAVDRGHADENPEELARFVGDFVFNPANGKTSFAIHAPTEILEAGTGFMMIRRKTLEKYQEAYPSFMYRPDHVRSADFDGSRPIMAFFDCIIDRGFGWDEVLPLLEKISNKQGTLEEFAASAQQLAEKQAGASMRYLSEDYLFCQNVRKAGMKVWLAPWMRLEHTGTYTFGGSLADLAALGAPATADVGVLQKSREKAKK